MILELKYPLKCGKSDENVKAHFLADDIYIFLSIMLYKNFRDIGAMLNFERWTKESYRIYEIHKNSDQLAHL